MTTLLAIDPGLRDCGVALFEGGRLIWVGWPGVDTGARGPEQWVAQARAVAAATPSTPDAVIFEAMEVYRRTSCGEAKQLLQLTGVSGAIAAQWPGAQFTTVRPRHWKGSISKAATARMLGRVLDADEKDTLRQCLDGIAEGSWHHVYDAVGIGLWRLRRSA